MKKYKDIGIYDFSDYAEEITGEDLIKINGGSSSCNGSGPENGGVSAASGGSGSKGSGSPLIGASSGSCGGSPSVPSGSSGNSGSGFSTSGSGSGRAPSSNTGSWGGSISSGAAPNVPNPGTPSGSTQTSSEYHGVPPQHWAALDEQKEKTNIYDIVTKKSQYNCWDKGDPNYEATTNPLEHARKNSNYSVWQECLSISKNVLESNMNQNPVAGVYHYYDKSLDNKPPYWSKQSNEPNAQLIFIEGVTNIRFFKGVRF